MRVKLKSNFADEHQTAGPGQVIAVATPIGRQLLAGGYAVQVDVESKAPRPDARETATNGPKETRAKPQTAKEKKAAEKAAKDAAKAEAEAKAKAEAEAAAGGENGEGGDNGDGGSGDGKPKVVPPSP